MILSRRLCDLSSKACTFTFNQIGKPTYFLKKLQESGDLVIYATNITQILWKTPKNDSSACNATTLELTDTGILSLKCEDGTITWSKLA